MRIDGWTLLLQAVNFLVLVWLLRRFLYRPVLAVIDKRRQAADAVLGDAAATRSVAEAALRDLETQRAAVGAERDRLLEAAHSRAEAERNAMLDKARREAEALLADARNRIERERREAAGLMRDRAGRLAVAIARRLVQSVVPEGDGATEIFLARACAALRALPADERAALADEVLSNGTVRVVTATLLDESVRHRCRERLAGELGVPVDVEFADDRALIAGVEVHFHHTVLRHTWRDDLARVLEELTADADAFEHA
jgi:F-type H+-transporting ATPase subunit b